MTCIWFESREYEQLVKVIDFPFGPVHRPPLSIILHLVKERDKDHGILCLHKTGSRNLRKVLALYGMKNSGISSIFWSY